MFALGQKHLMSNGAEYYFIEKHRRVTNNISKWTITFEEEFTLCENSLLKNYIDTSKPNYSYNVKKINNTLQQIGIRNDKPEYIARFERSNDRKEYHGYPIDHVARASDKPHNSVIDSLFRDQLITKKQKMNISRGKPL